MYQSCPVNRSAWRGFVDYGPECTELADGVDERPEVDRLYDVGVRAELVAANQILFFARGGEHHDGNGLQRLVGLQRAKHVEAVDLRHLQIQQEYRRVPRRPAGIAVAAVQV